MSKYLPKIIFIILYCNLSFAEQLLDQDVDISSGSTLSNDSGLTVRELSGGPYTIDNRGTIEATNITSNLQNIRLRVDNDQLLESNPSTNPQKQHHLAMELASAQQEIKSLKLMQDASANVQTQVRIIFSLFYSSFLFRYIV